ncbi:acyl-CoA dehydrogenase family protein [Nocardia aurantia]|uniref:Acyl-CoA oxidase/dehydrogenase middle domain-containing protein n=1 Tax=Nocardia aurantia TaxID=2585199 RepID=A0A7K0DH40_9NOCA|nr:acyl-CoA dehydrogenase family protein [Nocardia aurantia]MQY25126.1 hypothetical protein [Nocardia aurantia]
MTVEYLARHDVPAREARSWPLPGSGATGARWNALLDTARRDIVIGRLAEAHADAVAITAELDRPGPEADELWGVWAARAPGAALRAEERDGAFRLRGRKMWCSGAGICTHALVTAEHGDGEALFTVPLAAPGVRVRPETWAGIGMARAATLTVDFDGAQAQWTGSAEQYLHRAGFWHGAIGVAACWLGGALAVAAPLYAADRRDLLWEADVGAVDAALYGARATLAAAAAEIDAAPADRAAARIRARRVRAVIEDAAALTLDRVGRSLGARPLAMDPAHAQRVADLTVYLRQSHGDRDLADLGHAVTRR